MTSNTERQPSAATPPCPICGGLQWVSREVPVDHPDFGKLFPCTCQETDPARAKASALRASRDLAHLAHMTFTSFRPEGHAQNADQRASLQNAHDGARRFSAQPRGWLLIMGGFGVGKTHLAAAIANDCLARGVPVIFLNTPDLLDYLRATFSPQAEETYSQRFDQLLDAPLLILDDLGTQNATPWAEEKLFQLLNHRYIARLPTVITTNLSLDEIDARISSRLADLDLVRKLLIDAPDYRGSVIERRQSSLINMAHYQDKTFETLDLRGLGLSAEQRDSLKNAAAIAREFAELPQDWLVLLGDPGCGKTHLAAAIANHRLRHGHPVLFVVVPDLLDHLRAAFSPDSKTPYDQRFEEVRTAPLLVLDDLGTESATPWAKEKLYQIINYRYVARKATVITSNLKIGEVDPRIGSRIFDEMRCSVIPILAPSYRGGRTQERSTRPAKRTASARRRG